LLVAVLPIAAGVTILRRRAWGGYGFALVALAQLLVLPLLLVDNSSIPLSRCGSMQLSAWPAGYYSSSPEER
jgi:hypothetical protein